MTSHDSRAIPRCRPGLLLALLLSLALAAQWSLRADWRYNTHAEQTAGNISEACIEAIPRQIRSFAADVCWLRADEYMHFGPTWRLPATFIAGSYAGNTDILPLLELVIRLDPQRIGAYSVLVQNLALHLDRFTEGLRLLQRGILANRDHPRVHELYGTGAHLWWFRHRHDPAAANNGQAALRYVEEALARYRPPAPGDGRADPILYPRTYRIWQTRFLIVQKRLAEALAAWKAGGMPLGLEGGLMGEFLRRFEAGEAVPALPEDLLSPDAREAGDMELHDHPAPEVPCDHKDDHCSHHQETPAISMMEWVPPHLLRHLTMLLISTCILWGLAGPRSRRTFRAS